jgi:biopolymer transport protein ExbB
MSWDLVEMWHSMSFIPRAVVFTLVFMSVYCFATGIERAIVFSKAKKQSRDLLKLISALWREGKIEESVKLSADKRFKNSHLAKVLVAGLNELQFQQDSRSAQPEVVESAKRAIERATIKGVQA